MIYLILFLFQAPPLMTSGDDSDAVTEDSSKQHPHLSKEETMKEVKLPVALEQALAFKTVRAKEVGVEPDEIEKIGKVLGGFVTSYG